MIVAMFLAAQGVLPPMSDRSIAKALSKARPVASCTVGPDCDSKWRRAQRWVHDNSRFALVLDSDSALLTRPAIYANTDASYAITLDPPMNGIRTIRFRAWCGNWMACIPSPHTLRIMFSQAIADAAEVGVR